MVGAAYDLIKENGFVVPERDADALSRALEKIIHDREAVKAMGIISKKIINMGHQWPDMVRGFENAIQGALNKRMQNAKQVD